MSRCPDFSPAEFVILRSILMSICRYFATPLRNCKNVFNFTDILPNLAQHFQKFPRLLIFKSNNSFPPVLRRRGHRARGLLPRLGLPREGVQPRLGGGHPASPRGLRLLRCLFELRVRKDFSNFTFFSNLFEVFSTQ